MTKCRKRLAVLSEFSSNTLRTNFNWKMDAGFREAPRSLRLALVTVIYSGLLSCLTVHNNILRSVIISIAVSITILLLIVVLIEAVWDGQRGKTARLWMHVKRKQQLRYLLQLKASQSGLILSLPQRRKTRTTFNNFLYILFTHFLPPICSQVRETLREALAIAIFQDVRKLVFPLLLQY